MFTHSRVFSVAYLRCAFVVMLAWSVVAPADDATSNAPQLGRALSTAEIAALPEQVFADGTGLPEGSGNTVEGSALYLQHCAACHGGRGEGGSALELVGDRSLLATEYPDKGIAVYWPYAPTLFEYIRRSMPPDKPYSLTVNEVYSVIARLLELNALVPAGQQVDGEFLAGLEMPNRDGFRSSISD